MEALEQGFAALVDDRGLESAIVALALLPDFLDGEAGMDRVADDGGLRKRQPCSTNTKPSMRSRAFEAPSAVMPTISRPCAKGLPKRVARAYSTS